MKVILTTDVKKVGRKGELKEVSDGYAQNVLLPRKLALPGTAENLKRYQKAEERREDKKVLDETLLIKTLKEIDGKSVNVLAKANEKGKLFEAVHTKQVIDAIKKDLGVEIFDDVFESPILIKEVGEHVITLRAGKVNATLTLKID